MGAASLLLFSWTFAAIAGLALGRSAGQSVIMTAIDRLMPSSILHKGAGAADLLYKGAVGEDPEIYMDATQLITSKGFPCENYWVTTEDGYILNLLRIPHGRKNKDIKGPRPVAVLQHGLVATCTNFLTNPVNESLAYILADAGVDVWLGNSRGNNYSANHTTLHTDDWKFWEFTWDQMAKYDVPAMINFIVSKTGQDQLYYIGHSQGTTIGFIAFGEDHHLASHVKEFIALSPIAHVWNTESPIKILAPYSRDIGYFFDLFGDGEFNIPPSISHFIGAHLCDKWGDVVCEDFLFLLCGFDYSSLNKTRMPVYIAHTPSSTSVRDIVQWAQQIYSKQFRHFDYGSDKENLRHYNQTTPPMYDPKKMKVPVTIFRGGQDWLGDPTDVSWLLPQLNVVRDINIPHYEHLDFIWAYDAPKLIYNEIVKIIFPQ